MRIDCFTYIDRDELMTRGRAKQWKGGDGKQLYGESGANGSLWLRNCLRRMTVRLQT